MRARAAAGLRTALIVAGLASLAACGGGSTPVTPPPAPAPPTPVPPAPTPPEPPAPCTGVSLLVTFLGQGETAEIARGELTLDTSHPDAALDFASPYTIQVPDGGANLDIPGLRPTVGVFVSDLAFTSLGDGFRQTMTVEWLSRLEARARVTGCEPVTVTCDLQGCTGP